MAGKGHRGSMATGTFPPRRCNSGARRQKKMKGETELIINIGRVGIVCGSANVLLAQYATLGAALLDKLSERLGDETERGALEFAHKLALEEARPNDES